MKPALLIATAALTIGTAAASVRGDIDHQYKRWSKAALVNDVETILDVLAPDYTLHTYTGTVINHKAYEASLWKRRASKQAATVYVTSMAGIQVKGTLAEVISDESSAVVSVDPVTSKKLKLIHVHRYKDTWVKIGHSWRLRTTITTVESTKVVPITA